uniref:Crystallin zeta like 1 n=1 Tax=Pavo cristatus TaxID=9049 RepID=A0A8C9F1Z3_PAVCR
VFCFQFQRKFTSQPENLPPTGDNDVKVQVRACALSWIDTKLLSEVKLEKELLPVGREISGVVLEGILPLDSEESGLCEVVLVHEHYLAYTALHYLSQVSPGKTVLVMDGASPFGTIAIQLAQHRGAKVISTAYSLEDKQYLERLRPAVARVIDVSNGKIDVAESCLEETGGLGVDIVVDAGVKLYSAEDESTSKSQLLPHKHDIITLLGVGGNWITTERNLQLDPPDSHSLFLKGATVSFLNEEIWNLSNIEQGKYLYILLMIMLKDIMEKLSSNVFRPQLDEPIPLYEAKVSMEIVQKNQARKRQVIQF